MSTILITLGIAFVIFVVSAFVIVLLVNKCIKLIKDIKIALLLEWELSRNGLFFRFQSYPYFGHEIKRPT